jgi:ABC-type cobalamin/Fe3+-siderophores transport system ATPase subunit
MKLRYLHLRRYPPLEDVSVVFSSSSPLKRECAISFVVGVNGSGKSHLLQAIAEVFVALAEERTPHFPVSLVYELGRANEGTQRTLLLDCPGSREAASLWVAERFVWPNDSDAETFVAHINTLRARAAAPLGWTSLIAPGQWPSRPSTPPGLALPVAVLAYTTGDLAPWRALWQRNGDAGGADLVSQDPGYDKGRERPADWSRERELSEAARRSDDDALGQLAASRTSAATLASSATTWQPVLVTLPLLKLALLAVALPLGLRQLSQPAEARFEDAGVPLRALLDRSGWQWPLSVSIRVDFQPYLWRDAKLRRALRWFLAAGEVIADPPPGTRRMLHFDLCGPLDGTVFPSGIAMDAKAACATQGQALLDLIGGASSSSFQRFQLLTELHHEGLIEDLRICLRKTETPDAICFDELSDGEQMVLGRMALFHLLEGQDDALLLLDEPETHFNDGWKREVVDIIDGAIGRTANDVVIATHSAIMLTDAFNDEIVLIRKQATGSVAAPVEARTFAADPSELIIRVFGAEDSVGQRAREHIEHLLACSTGTAEDIKRIRSLVERMGSGFYRSELLTLLNRWQRRA